VSESALPILYSFRRCPYAMRARLALAISEQPCELREVELRNRPEELREVSPKATVPVVVLPEGRILDESFEIMLWTLQKHDPEGWLAKESLTATTMLVARCESEFKPHLDRYKYTNRYEGIDSEEHRELASHYLRALEDQLAKTKYLFGSKRTLADMAIAPFVRQFAFADRDWFDEQSWTHLRAWLDEFIATPLFEGVMTKRAKWEPGSTPLIVSWNEP
jgi:glutathione S-transferase